MLSSTECGVPVMASLFSNLHSRNLGLESLTRPRVVVVGEPPAPAPAPPRERSFVRSFARPPGRPPCLVYIHRRRCPQKEGPFCPIYCRPFGRFVGRFALPQSLARSALPASAITPFATDNTAGNKCRACRIQRFFSQGKSVIITVIITGTKL